MPGELVRRVGETPPDSTVVVGLMRGKTSIKVKARLARSPGFTREHRVILGGGAGPPQLGVQIHALNDGMAGYFGVAGDEGASSLMKDFERDSGTAPAWVEERISI